MQYGVRIIAAAGLACSPGNITYECLEFRYLFSNRLGQLLHSRSKNGS